MLFIKQNAGVFDIEWRFSNGRVNYTAMPIAGARWRFAGMDNVILENGNARITFNRKDFVVPHGETFQSFMNYLLNPSPNIFPYGSGGGVAPENVSPTTIIANYSVLPTDTANLTKIVFGAALVAAKLPLIATSIVGRTYTFFGGDYGGRIACWDPIPYNDRILGEVEFWLNPQESISFYAADLDNWLAQ